jgi:hypothetical protein
MKSLRVPSAANAPSSAGCSLRKIDNFLPSRPGLDIVFQKGQQAELALLGRFATGTSALRAGNDSGMAPQAVKNAKNGLGNGKRQLARLGKRIDQANAVVQPTGFRNVALPPERSPDRPSLGDGLFEAKTKE